jgi:thioesterase domain-containing protein
VARGYLNRPALTAERFIPDWFGGEPGARLYRSGDQARWLPDGDIEYLGRIDQQVKIRGYRIELGEIEAMLLRHPSVREALVLAREDQPGDKRLVAYLVAEGSAVPAGPELRTFLKGILPEYMIPWVFVVLDALPLTPNGKVDRKALPAPDPVGLDSGESFAAPRTPTEHELVRIWCQLLRVEKIGIHDNFFDLGGHSLLATQVFSRINALFPVKVPLRRIFETPTVAGLAEAIEGEGACRVQESLRLLKPGGSGPALFLVHDGVGDTLVYGNLARRMPELVKVFGIDPHATGYCPILHTRIPDMAASYVQKIREVQPEGPYFLGGLCAGGTIAFEMALQLEAQGFPIGFVALLDTPGPQMPRKAWLTQQRSLARFTASLRAVEGDSRLDRLLRKSAKAARKLRNLLVYESTSRAKKLSDTIRFRLLRGVLDRGRPVPRFVQGLAVQTVLELAVKEYVQSRLLEGTAVLIRATEGEGIDEPAVNVTTDPLLDWGGRIKGELEIFDMPGGHSSMLQERHVDELAKYLSGLMDQALAAQVAV